MIKLSNLADYAVVLMSHMALKPEHVHAAAEISAHTGIPLPTVSKILGTLVRGGILQSLRGLNGGFKMSRSAEDITIADIVQAVDGPVQLTNCIGTGASECDHESNCLTRGQWHRINDAVKQALDSVPLSDMTASIPDFIGSAAGEEMQSSSSQAK